MPRAYLPLAICFWALVGLALVGPLGWSLPTLGWPLHYPQLNICICQIYTLYMYMVIYETHM